MATNPESVSFLAPKERDDLSGHLHRQVIGYLGFLLPALIWLLSVGRPTTGQSGWMPLSSVSAYYYSGAVAVFTGILSALAVFFFTYPGYGNKSGSQDRIFAWIAGIAAVLVALFPTEAPNPELKLSWWVRSTGWIHFIAATILFLDFAYFSLFLFTKAQASSSTTPRGHKVRIGVYVVCGVLMVICIIWAGIAKVKGAPIFLPEALALEFFALSWLAKGRAEWTAWQAVRHPLKLVAKVNHVIRGTSSGGT